MYDPDRSYVAEQVVKNNTEWASLRDLCVGDIITTAVELWAVPAGERYLVEDYSRNGWITLVKQTSTGLNCWDDVPGSARKFRANGTTVRRITSGDPFHHLNNRGR